MINKTADDMVTYTIEELIEEHSNDIAAALKKGSLKDIPALFLWGPPGVGKTEGIYQLCELVEEKTGKKCMVHEMSLSLKSPNDLQGLPALNPARDAVQWIVPEFFKVDPSEDVVNIFFFDELSAVSREMQVAAYKIVLEHKVGEYKLPDNCVVVAAGNRICDSAVAYKQSSALSNKMGHAEIVVDFDSWRRWAMVNQIHPLVLGYLAFDHSKLLADSDVHGTAYASPRSWSFVSGFLNRNLEGREISELYKGIGRYIGSGAALEFTSWCKNNGDIPRVEDVFKGKAAKLPKTMDKLYLLVNALSKAVKEKESRTPLTDVETYNLVVFAIKLPVDYQVCLLHNLMQIQGFNARMMKDPLFKKWIEKVGAICKPILE